MSRIAPLSVVIPTFERGEILVATVESLLAQDVKAAEIVLVDQTPAHPPEVERRLSGWQAGGTIRWLRMDAPSIPKAMNVGLLASASDLVLFLDDDIVPAPDLIGTHAVAHAAEGVVAVVGQVLQPGEEESDAEPGPRGSGLRRDLTFPFRGVRRGFVSNCMAGNLSVHRHAAVEAGGFDENFVGVAYRFETEFCRRLERTGGRVLFEPAARIRHLQAPRGGTRAVGDRFRSASPAFSVGDYYFAIREGRPLERVTYAAERMLKEVSVGFYRRRPWWIPVKLLAEIRGLSQAIHLVRGGPKLLIAGRSNDAVPPEGVSAGPGAVEAEPVPVVDKEMTN